MSNGLPFWCAGLALGLAVLSGCSDDGANSGGGGEGTGNSAAQAGEGGSGGQCFGCASGGGDFGTLTLQPPAVTIEVVDGVAVPVDFDAFVGDQEVLPSGWVVDLSGVAGTDGDGVVTATGNVGGLVTLTATYEGLTATAPITVNLKKTLNPGGFSPEDIDKLKNPSGGQDASIVWAYPYDKTVFPKGLLAPELMWNNGGAGDKYYIHFKGPFTEFDIFTTADPPARYPVDPAVWVPMTESGPGGNVDFKVNRLPSGAAAATTVIDHDWTVANGALRGTVYYWANNIGRVMRIKPGAGAPEDFLAAAGVTDGCSTCHSVSADGSTLILGGDVSTSTFDLLANTPVLSLPSVGKPVRNWAMPAISPDGSTVIENNAQLPGPPGGSDGMFDAVTGQKITGTGLDGVLLDMPAFAPDGSNIAYVDHNTLGLGVYQWNPVTKAATNPVALVPAGADPQLAGICFPSVAPDAEWVVYHRGTYPGSLDTRFGPGSMYLASTTQPGVEVRLRNANGDDYPFAAGDRDRLLNYEPTFAPLEAGGYAWVVFTSRRTYGNRLTGGSGSVKQLWVAAVDADPTDGVDPSHPAFLIPGQDLGTLNMRGFWALDPCKQVGDSCEQGSECCNSNCEEGICTEPDPDGCSQNGSACMEDADCCDPTATCNSATMTCGNVPE
jgi:hypothetical protein